MYNPDNTSCTNKLLSPQANSPPLVLRGPSDKSPVNADRLAHQVLAIEPFHGSLGLFVRLILYQCIPLGTVIRTSLVTAHS